MCDFDKPVYGVSWTQQLVTRANQIPAAARTAVLGKSELRKVVRKSTKSDDHLDVKEVLKPWFKMERGRARMGRCFVDCADSKETLCKQKCVSEFINKTFFVLFLKYGAHIPMFATEADHKVYLNY
jgi:hypothetical protein